MKPDPKRGGKREGAGRPFLYDEPTVPIRVPASLAEWIKANIETIRKIAQKPPK